MKSFYIGRARQLRVDYLIYLLSSVVIADYRLDALKSMYGVKDINLTMDEERRKKKAFQLDYDIANAMIEQIDEVVSTKIISVQFEDVAKQVIIF